MQTKLFKRVLTGVLSAALVITGVTIPTGNLQAAKTVKKLTVSQTLDDGTTAAVKKKGTVNVAYPKNAADAKYVAKGNFNVELTGKGASKGFKLKGAGTPVGDTGFFVEQTAAGTAEKVSVKVISKAKNKKGKKLKFPFKVAFAEDSTWTVATSLSIAVDKTTLLVGDTAQITATVEPKDATITYSSDKEAVATVDATGKIEAKGAGEATITAKAGDKTDSVVVTVYAEAIKITGVELDNLKPQAGDTLTATLVPANAMNVAGYSWTINGAAIPDTNEPTYTIPETAKIGDKYNVVVTDTEGATFTAAAPAVVSDKEEPVVIVNLTDAVQTKANELKLTFDANASEIVQKGDIEVAAEDGTLVIPLNNLTFTEDGLTAYATLSVALTDGKSYSVSYGDNKVSGLVASVGAVASVVVDTVSAEVKVKTPIKFSLYDEKGIDVTSAQNLDATCQVTVAGDMTYDVSKASTASITMDTVGQTAEVTVTYNSNENGAKDIVGTQTITATAAQAVYGDPLYAVTTDVNDNSLCAKFYDGAAMTDKVVIGEGKSTDNLYFCAVDKDGNAISYDSYGVASSADDVANAAIGTADNGKYAKISVSGNKVGEASVIVTATKNGVDSIYSIPVKVVKSGILDHITVTASKTAMSNAYDSDYYGYITVKALDANGLAADDCQYAYEITSGKTDAVAGLQDAWGLADGVLGFDLEAYANIAEYTAWGAQAGSRTIKVTVSQGDIEKTQSVTVNVAALAPATWNIGDTEKANPAKATYQVEMSSNTLDEANVAGAPSIATARLAAYFGSNFAGYVRQINGKVFIGNQVAGNASAGNWAVYALRGESDDILFTAEEIGSQYNGFNFVEAANTKGVAKVYSILNEKDSSKSAVFTATTAGVNNDEITWAQDLQDEVCGQYTFKLTDGTTAWADGDTFTIDTETVVLTSAISNADMAKEMLTLITSDADMAKVYTAVLTGAGDEIELTRVKKGESYDADVAPGLNNSKGNTGNAITMSVVSVGTDASAGSWTCEVTSSSLTATAAKGIILTNASSEYKIAIPEGTTGGADTVKVIVDGINKDPKAKLVYKATDNGDGTFKIEELNTGVTQNSNITLTQSGPFISATTATPLTVSRSPQSAVYTVQFNSNGSFVVGDSMVLDGTEYFAKGNTNWTAKNVVDRLNAFVTKNPTLAAAYASNVASTNLRLTQNKGKGTDVEPVLEEGDNTGTGDIEMTVDKEGVKGIKVGVTSKVYNDEDDDDENDYTVWTIHTGDKATVADLAKIWTDDATVKPFKAATGEYSMVDGENAYKDETVYNEDTKTYTIYSDPKASLSQIVKHFKDKNGFFTAAVVKNSEYTVPGLVEAGKDGGSSVLVTEATQIENIKAGVKFGAKYSINGDLFNSAKNINYEKDQLATYETRLWIDTVNNEGNKFYVEGDATKDGYFARVGSYTAVFTYNNVADGKEGTQSAAFTVRNSNYIPKVNVIDRNVEGLDPSSVKEVLTASVDMNNNESASFSVVDGLYSAVSVEGATTDATENSGKMTVKYVGVVEDGITYYIPINSTFQTK